jgi:hypothetical protein
MRLTKAQKAMLTVAAAEEDGIVYAMRFQGPAARGLTKRGLLERRKYASGYRITEAGRQALKDPQP